MTTTATSATAPLIKHEEIAEGTMAFHFTKPPDFQFRAGQSVDMTLLDPSESDGEGNTRAFSLASAPFDDDLMIATRMRDTAFKRALRKAAIGLRFQNRGPERIVCFASQSGETRSVHGGGDWHHSVLEHHPASDARQNSAPDVLVLLQSPARGCSVPGCPSTDCESES